MANVSSSNGLEKRPKLRFPGFDEPWRAERLSDFADRVTRKNSQNQTDLPLTISSKDGLVDQVSYFNKTVASKDMSGYYLLLNGEYAYNKSYSVGYDFGSIKRLDRYPMGALSTLYICFALKKHDSDFIKAYFDSLKWYREIYMISAEGARNHGLLNVPTDEFFETKHYLPQNLNEQRKIAAFIIALERRIDAQQSLVDNLKKYKRGAIVYILSGKTNKFAAEASWTEKTLADLCCEFRSGRNISASRIHETGEYAVYGGNGIRGYCDHYNHEGEYVVVGRQGALCGNVRLIQGKNYLSEHAIAVRANDENDTKFLLFLLDFMKLGQYSDQGAQPGLAVNKLLKLKCTVPDKKTQSRIASFLLNIDLQIYNHEKMLSLLVDQWKAFLQQLFI
ncbi:restriction endonuclease subunit S [Ruminococcus bromii]|uniref:restriction endonuclease subunit S n=1 Tax=Ruminococcus bromii TaxID=40518 RepID=UPI00292E4A63|nr:restriction endonuclease subunit S [Ruminococcus bromii]MDE8725988.1 restriction endonuclease subunit S [Ruminococcus bromii]